LPAQNADQNKRKKSCPYLPEESPKAHPVQPAHRAQLPPVRPDVPVISDVFISYPANFLSLLLYCEKTRNTL